MKRLIALLVAGTALTAAAPVFAADLLEPVPVAPMAEAIPDSAFDWTGAYIGGTVGYGWATASFGNADRDFDDFTGSLFAGYNYAVTPEWVVGAEADVGISPGDTFRLNGNRVETSTTVYGTLRGRVGYAFDNFLVYGTGGLLVGQGDAEFNGGSDSKTHIGFAVGGGVEAALTENITARAEYMYLDTSEETYSVGNQSEDADLDAHVVRAGLAYKF